MREISWIRAYASSAVVHLLVVGAAAMFLAGAVMQQEQQQMYVIDLDTSELSSAGSGHAGGGSGGELFPEKLSETAVAERVAQIDASQSAVMPHPQLSDAVPEPAPSSQPAPAAAPPGEQRVLLQLTDGGVVLYDVDHPSASSSPAAPVFSASGKAYRAR